MDDLQRVGFFFKPDGQIVPMTLAEAEAAALEASFHGWAKDKINALRREYESIKGVTLTPDAEVLFVSVTISSSGEIVISPKKE